MKKIFIVIALIVSVNLTWAQKIGKFEVNTGLISPLGNLGKSDINSSDSHFVEYGVQTDITFKAYSAKGIGLGFRFAGAEMYVDESMFARKLLTDRNADSFANYGLSDYYINNISFQIAASYNLQLGRHISVEPFFNFGADILTIPEYELHYLQSGATHMFRQSEFITSGFSINPGLNVNFEFGKFIGLQLYGSYSKAFMEKYDAERLVVGPTSIDNPNASIDLSPEYLSFGIGLTLNMWKRNKE